MKGTFAFRNAGALMGCSICLTSLAGDFYNLGFDNPLSTELPYSELVLNPQSGNYTRWYGDSTSLVPGWQLSPSKVFILNSPPFLEQMEPGTSLASGNWGAHSLAIRCDDYDWTSRKPVYFQVSLSQTAMVPANAHGLRFYSETAGNTFKLALDNTPVQVEPIGFGSHVYEVNVSPFAGVSLDVELTFLERYYGVFDIQGFVDAQGTLITIPEPSTFASLGLGGLGLAWAARRRRVS